MYKIRKRIVDGNSENVVVWKLRDPPPSLQDVMDVAQHVFPVSRLSDLRLSVNGLFTEPVLELSDPF
jgi:hypothetical protein